MSMLSEAWGHFLNGFRKGMAAAKVQEEIKEIDSMTTLNREFVDRIAGYLISENEYIEPSLVTKTYENVFLLNKVCVERLLESDAKKYKPVANLVADVAEAAADTLDFWELSRDQDWHVETYLDHHQRLLDAVSMVNFELSLIRENA